MRLPRRLDSTGLGLFVVACLALAACHRQTSRPKISPPRIDQASLQAAKKARLDWNMETLAGAYQRGANTNPKWDEPAKSALTEFARSRSSLLAPDEDSTEIISNHCRAAVDAGCDDPMIRYLYIRCCMDQTNSPRDFATALCGVALDMQKSSYPSIRKFYAEIRAEDQLIFAYGTNVMSVPALHEMQAMVAQNIMATIQEKTMPPEEVYEACHEAMKELDGPANNDLYPQAFSSLEQFVFANWPKASESWLFKGEVYIKMAWNARGGGYASTVTAEGGRIFAADLDVASQSLQRAWELNPGDPRIAVKMISVELGQGNGRDTMESWFQNAMKLDPNDNDACAAKLLYIEPKWYGSVEDMLRFGRECVQNTSWGGRVPLIEVDAHADICSQYIDKTEQAGYWKRPEVWRDVKAAYERFFDLNPKATGYYKNYAWHAWHAEQWDDFNELAQKIPPADYNFFGGKNEFDKMVQLAKEHAKSAGVKK